MMQSPNHALQRTGTAELRSAVNRPLSLVSLGGFRVQSRFAMVLRGQEA